MINCKKALFFFFLLTYYSNVLSEQHFVDETLDRLPQREDHAREVEFGDLDDDGDLDVVVVCAGISNYKTYLLKNDGDGYFPEDSLNNLFSLQYNLSSVSLGDVERDDDYDLLFTDYDEQEHLLINNGEAIFTDESLSRLPYVLYPNSTNGALIDVNTNLSLDISISNSSWNHNYLWLNSGNGYFSIASNQFPSGNENSNDLAWGDIDGDFDLDCVIANNTGYPNRVMINDGTGWFTDETDERIPEDLNQSNGVILVDLDGDRDLDVVVANGWFPGDEKVFINDGSGYFTDESSMRIPQDGGSSNNAAYGDIDCDGDFDLMISNFSSSGVDNKLYINDGSGYFIDETDNRFPSEEEETGAIVLSDIDYDGDLDCFVVNIGDYYSGQQNRLLINISTPDTFPSVIAKTLIHEDTSDTTGPYMIASSIWDNVSIAKGELNVYLYYTMNGDDYNQADMYDCGGFMYRYGIPGAPQGSKIGYYIEATDKMGNTSFDPPNAPDSVYSFMVTGTGIDKEAPDLEFPKAYYLSQNYPNPFNPSTVIRYHIPDGQYTRVSLVVYNLHGKLVNKLVDEVKSPGTHSVSWDGRNEAGIRVASGVYFYRIKTDDFTSTRKMTLVR